MRQDSQAALDSTFRLTLDSTDITEHEGWRVARDHVLAAVARGPGLVALLGPAGTGKTLLLRELARTLRAAGREAELVGRGDLQFEARAGEITLVDEAARMAEAPLHSLSMPGVTAVLTDLPSFDARLGGATTVVRLAPLEGNEVGAFLADRLARAGQPSDLLTANAVETLALHSAGVPRVLNLLARAALFMAETEGAAQVEERHVSLAVALREGGLPEMDALSKAPVMSIGLSRGRIDAVPCGDLCEDIHPAEYLPVRDAGALPSVSPAGPVVLPTLEPVAPEPLPSASESLTESIVQSGEQQFRAPQSGSRIRAFRQGAALLAASALLVASLVAGRSLGPHLAQTVRAALASATASPASVPASAGTSAAGNSRP